MTSSDNSQPRQIFITGVSSGIGAGLARAFLKRDCSVYGVSRRSPEGLGDGASFRHECLDVTKFDQAPSTIRKLLAGVTALDLAVLNAGVLGNLRELEKTPLEELKRVVDVNLWGVKAVIDALFALQIPIGQIVTISSGAAVRAERGWGGYSISKAALNMLTAVYAAEHRDTHFCALAPGIVDTPMQAAISALPDDPKNSAVQFLKKARGTPMMPDPDSASETLLEAFERARVHPSGSYLDCTLICRLCDERVNPSLNPNVRHMDCRRV